MKHKTASLQRFEIMQPIMQSRYLLLIMYACMLKMFTQFSLFKSQSQFVARKKIAE